MVRAESGWSAAGGGGDLCRNVLGRKAVAAAGNRRAGRTAGPPGGQFVTFTSKGALPSVLKAADQWPFFMVAEQEIATSLPENRLP